MIRTILALLCLAAAGAVELETPMPPKVDAIYRSYLAALAKAYQAETAKLDAQLKREAAAAKRDPDLLAAITKLQEKIKTGDQMTDFAGLVSSDLLGADQIQGGEAAIIGSWALDATNVWEAGATWSLTMKSDHTAIQEVSTAHSQNSYKLRWVTKDKQIQITVADSQFALRQWLINLPIPATGPVTITDKYTGRGPNTGSNSENVIKATRKP